MDAAVALHPSVKRLLSRDFPYTNQLLVHPRVQQEQVQARTLLEAEQWGTYIALYHGHDPLRAFVALAPAMADEDYWRLLASIWVYHDVVHDRLRTWRRLFRAARAKREHLMDDYELERWAALPGRVEVFRGFRHEGGQDGLAWTLDRDVALRFARGEAIVLGNQTLAEAIPSPDAFLASAVVPHACVAAFFNREDEVIVPSFRGYARRVERVERATITSESEA
jgi:hypothetical protein